MNNLESFMMHTITGLHGSCPPMLSLISLSNNVCVSQKVERGVRCYRKSLRCMRGQTRHCEFVPELRLHSAAKMPHSMVHFLHARASQQVLPWACHRRHQCDRTMIIQLINWKFVASSWLASGVYTSGWGSVHLLVVLWTVFLVNIEQDTETDYRESMINIVSSLMLQLSGR